MIREPYWQTDRATLYHGDCLDVLRTLPDASVDAVVTDPPYAEIDRQYGRMTEPEWHSLMDAVVGETRRLLRPTGSAMFVLQPNSECVGRMRPWLFDFMAKQARAWNMIQDVWWWNYATAPTIHCSKKYGLMRPTMKAVVWLGDPNAYRNQASVTWTESDAMRAVSVEDRALQRRPSGQSVRPGRIAESVQLRGGVTPMNVWPVSNANSSSSSGAHGHGAGTPKPLCDRMVQYICPPGGVILDMFTGGGTVGVSAVEHGFRFIGIEREAEYLTIAKARIAKATEDGPGLFGGAQ